MVHRATRMAELALHRIGPFEIPHVGARHVRVCVPPRDPHAPSPVLYVFDGQNVFDDAPSYAGGWHLHRAVCALAKRAGRAPVVVGVEHGGEARIAELSPWGTARGASRTDALLDWMVGTLAPLVQGEFRVSSAPGEVGIGGSSLGGLAALYAHFRNPERFGLVLAMSPSLWVGRGRIFAYVASRPKPWTSRIYLDAGGLEGGGGMLRAAERLAGDLRARGWDDGALRFVAAKRGTHSEKSWRRRAPGALTFLFAPGAERKKR
jgi:predicted alpha/beta superfamily hydrolase